MTVGVLTSCGPVSGDNRRMSLMPNQAPAMKTSATASTQKICFTRRTAKIHDANSPDCHEGNFLKEGASRPAGGGLECLLSPFVRHRQKLDCPHDFARISRVPP